jgi:D-3-phosphoglycerate dehydrogenase / 2-oxoglutarate reductase
MIEKTLALKNGALRELGPMTVRIVYVDCSTLMRGVLDELGPPGALIVHEGDPPRSELSRLMSDAFVVLNGHTAMDAALLSSATKLRSIVFLGTGASSRIDLDAASRRDIRVRTIRNYGDRTVAEHAFALLLSAARDVVGMDRDVRSGCWSPSEGIELAGRTLGLVGLGGIGSEMARIATAFGMRVIAWNRSGVPPGVPAEPAELDALLSEADAVSLHLALVPQTRGLLNTQRLARMKPGAILVNTARGALVDEAALVEALGRGHIGHAALDVFAAEPLPADHPLTRLDRVTLTSHAGWKSKAAARRLLQLALDIAAEDARCLAAGEPLSK